MRPRQSCVRPHLVVQVPGLERMMTGGLRPFELLVGSLAVDWRSMNHALTYAYPYGCSFHSIAGVLP